ncbi:MAG: substrate-binding domain-containing protein [Gammaproteobacteria bacterium]|nr:substrate-binding domain-containing protein [Gammaproteobacteria bacterium]
MQARFRLLLSAVLFGLLALTLSGCGDPAPEVNPETSQKPELLIYCGITMANPMKAIAEVIEKEQNVKITINQGASEDLYKSLATSRLGDLYLPGSPSYRENHLAEGLLGDFVHIGYNQSALLVKRGNPHQVKPELDQLQRTDLVVGICSPESGSIGRETKKVLEAHGSYQQVLNNSSYMKTDSRNLNRALKAGEIDLTLNWRSTAFFPENRTDLQVIDLDPKLVQPKKLLLIQLNFSQHPQIAQRVMEFAASAEGQAIMRRFGFVDRDGKVDY